MASRYCDELWNSSNCLTSNDWENFAFGRSGRHFCSCWLDENLETMADFSFFGQFRPMFCRRPWLWFFLNLASNDKKSRIWEMKCEVVEFLMMKLLSFVEFRVLILTESQALLSKIFPKLRISHYFDLSVYSPNKTQLQIFRLF